MINGPSNVIFSFCPVALLIFPFIYLGTCSMEPETGVVFEDEKCISVVTSVVDMNLEDQNADLGEKVATLNGNAEHSEAVTKSDYQNSSAVVVEGSATVLKSKNSKTNKVDRTPEVFNQQLLLFCFVFNIS